MQQALAWLKEQSKAMEIFLSELVEISSHTPNLEGVNEVASTYLSGIARLCRGQIVGELLDGGKFGQHVVARTAAAGPHLLLVGHHDTVFPRTSFAGFRQEGAHLFGPGVFDMKGGLTVIAYALAALAEARMLANIPVRLVSVSDEEIGSPDGRHVVLEHSKGATSALVFESGRSGDLIVTQRKGTGGLTVVAHGKAAHAGKAHEAGANAIWALARFIDRAQALTDYDRGITINVGRIEGGIGKNTVPERAEAKVDFRFLTNDDGDSVVVALTRAAEEAAKTVAGTRIDVSGGILRRPLERTAASAELAITYGAAQTASGLGAGEATLAGGGSDANTCAEAGVPAIDGLGPRGFGYHTTDERIDRDSLIPKAEALVRFLATRAVR